MKHRRRLFLVSILVAIVLGIATAHITLLPLVDYLGIAGGEGKIRNGPWITDLRKGTDDQGFVQRAIIAKIGVGNLTKEESLVWNTFDDSNGERLHSSNDYTVHFPGPMPVEDIGFWSLTLYDKTHYLAANPINRYSLGSRDELKRNPDGSFTILVSSDMPADTSNWLPAPRDDFFTLNVRCYVPTLSMLDDPQGVHMPVVQRLLK